MGGDSRARRCAAQDHDRVSLVAPDRDLVLNRGCCRSTALAQGEASVRRPDPAQKHFKGSQFRCWWSRADAGGETH